MLNSIKQLSKDLERTIIVENGVVNILAKGAVAHPMSSQPRSISYVKPTVIHAP